VDGWYRDFYPYENRERNVGQATLLGGLVTYTTYQPFNDVCQAEGNAYLYGLYYRTGTGWYKSIFGSRGVDGNNNAVEKLSLGRGLATTPNLHVGSGEPGSKGAKAFIQTSTGEIQEIEQDNLPISDYRTGRSSFRQCN
jgi:type IV pilus assembly protein PilY1